MPATKGLTDLRRAATALLGEGRRLGAAAVILDPAGGVLMARHAYGHHDWELPSAGTDPGESLDETAVRGAREEAGLDVRVERLTGLYYERDADIHHAVFLCARRDAARPPAANRPEIDEVGYFPADRLPRPTSDFTLRRVRDALAGAPVAGLTVIQRRRWLRRDASRSGA